MIRRSRNRWLAIAAGLFGLLMIALVLPPLFRSEPTPASPAELQDIAERNEKAALEAALVMRQQSEASARASDAALSRAEDRGKAEAEDAIREFDANESERQAGPIE